MVATWLLVIAHFLSQAFRKSGEARGKKGREKIKTVSPRCSLTFLTSRRSQLSERLLNTLSEHYLNRPLPDLQTTENVNINNQSTSISISYQLLSSPACHNPQAVDRKSTAPKKPDRAAQCHSQGHHKPSSVRQPGN